MISFFRLSAPIIIRCVEIFLLGVIAWQLSSLVWWVFAPSSGSVSLTMPLHIHSSTSRDPFFRWYSEDAEANKEVAGDYSLLAVIAGKDGVAVLKDTEGVSAVVRVGGEIRSGSKLISVEPQSVRIEQGSMRQNVRFPQNDLSHLLSGLPPSVADKNTDSKAKSPSSRQPAPLQSIRISRGQMVSAMQGMNVAGWDKGLSASPEGGIRVEQSTAQPVLKLLQFKDGDLIKRINKQPLDSLADISLISHYFGQSASVDIDLVRNGAAFIQHYDIQP